LKIIMFALVSTAFLLGQLQYKTIASSETEKIVKSYYRDHGFGIEVVDITKHTTKKIINAHTQKAPLIGDHYEYQLKVTISYSKHPGMEDYFDPSFYLVCKNNNKDLYTIRSKAVDVEFTDALIITRSPESFYDQNIRYYRLNDGKLLFLSTYEVKKIRFNKQNFYIFAEDGKPSIFGISDNNRVLHLWEAREIEGGILPGPYTIEFKIEENVITAMPLELSHRLFRWTIDTLDFSHTFSNTKPYVELQHIKGVTGNDYLSSYFFQDVDSSYSLERLRILRNTIFARHGHSFDSKDLRDYFSAKPWYREVKGKKVGKAELSEREWKMLNRLRQLEKKE
jgi:hypothetical protein